MIRKVSIDEAHDLHTAIIELVGGKAGMRDFSLLHSALERPFATFDGIDLYPGIFLKAAALLDSLCLNHAFTDGNKRTAWATTKLFLHRNGYHLKAKPVEGADFMVHVDNEKPNLKEIALWLKSHSKQSI